MTAPDVLYDLLSRQAYVLVANHRGDVWSGRIMALADDPSMVIEAPDGTRAFLPQRFEVSEIPVPPDGAPSEYVKVRREDLQAVLLVCSAEDIDAALERLRAAERDS